MEFLLCIIALLAIIGSKFQKKSTKACYTQDICDPLDTRNYHTLGSPYYRGDVHIID